MTIILDGKKLSEEIIGSLKGKVKGLGLAAILIGNDPASLIYVNIKERKCEELGIYFEKYHLDENINEYEAINLINRLNNDKKINGILVQLPLPDKFNREKILDSINPRKDVDCLTSFNLGRLLKGGDFAPCTPKGIIRLFDKYNINVEGKKVTIINHSNLIGKPLATMLLKRGATVTICHSKTKDIKEFTLNADIIITATGKHGLITKDMIKEPIIIDAGVSKVNDKIVGDCSEDVKEKSSYITPVPNGVGPMTVAMLIENLLYLQ